MSTSTKVADLLVELGTEELPPTALTSLSNAFTQNIGSGLEDAGLQYLKDGVKSFATPRRLAVIVPQVETHQADKSVEKLGPAISAAYDKEGKPSKAATGFARSNGVTFEELVTSHTDKGERLCFRSVVNGQATAELLEDIINKALNQLPIPKRMRWGASRTEFVRPVHWAVVLLDEQIVKCKVLGITSGNQTFGHRFHAPDAITLDSPSEYESELLNTGQVIADFNQRRNVITKQVEQLAIKLGGNAVIEPDLLDEVTALVEKPVALGGDFDSKFLLVPQEALIYSMSEHQKYFHLIDDKGSLLPHFITVSNIASTDPEKIIRGNERVIQPRLADAAFFFDTDKKVSLTLLRNRLKTVVFQKQLGTVYEKSERIGILADSIANLINADQKAAKLAGELCKADLASDMVLEFDKMQGTAGGHYALNDGLSSDIADAIKTHYLPKFAGDEVPTSKIGCAVALADRLDTLTGIFGIGQIPSGSKDPFALRRASIGILQIILKNQLNIDVDPLIRQATELHSSIADKNKTVAQVLEYLFGRFAALYQDQGLPAEVFTAIKAKKISQPLDFDARVKAVAAFIQTSESEGLASANKRVRNILEKSEQKITIDSFDSSLLVEPAERTLADRITEQEKTTTPLFANGNYREGLLKLTELKDCIDTFFNQVMVNVEDEKLKNNRLALLLRLRILFLAVADISVLAIGKK